MDRLTAELAMFRQVIDEIREDFSWVTRNGLPVRPIEHIHVKRMALDPCAEDWGEHLEIERSTYYPPRAASPLESVSLDTIAEELKSAFESVAQGQLEVVLSALDGVRAEILSSLRHRCGGPENTVLSAKGEPPTPVSPPAPANLFGRCDVALDDE